MKKIAITIVDDHELFVNGIKLLLEKESWIEITGSANNGKELLTALRAKVPDIILLDINMPILNGFKAVNHIGQLLPKIRIIFLSSYSELHLIEKAKSLGVKGYLLKNSSKEELFQVIKLVASGQTYFPIREKNKSNEFETADDFLKQFHITKRELEILQLIKIDLTNQQIADQLFLSVYTVETHRKNIMHKLGLNTPGRLIKFIFENNI